MFEIILCVMFVFFAVIGVSYVTESLWLFLIRPKKRNKTAVITKLDKDYAKDQFMYFFEKFRWDGNGFADEIIFVSDEPLDESCTAFCKAYNNINYCHTEDITTLLKYKLEEEND